MPMDQGTYVAKESGGKGIDKGEWSYQISLLPGNLCWMDYSKETKVNSTSYHAEGTYEEIGDVEKLKYTVKTSMGGGPQKGDVLEWEVQGNKVIVVDGMKCAMIGGMIGIEEVEEYAAETTKIAAAVPKAVPQNASTYTPGELQAIAQPTMLTEGFSKTQGRKELDVRNDATRGQGYTQQPAAKAPAPATPVPEGCFSLEDLQNADVWKAKGVDAGKREEYLSDDHFQNVFEMSKADFAAQPKWKQETQKKKHGLY
jgi:hypothetical protein